MNGRLKFWGWGYEDDGLNPEGVQALLQTFADDFGIRPNGEITAPRVEDIALAAPRLRPTAAWSRCCGASTRSCAASAWS